MGRIEDIESLLVQCTPAERMEVFRLLRKEFNIHPIEEKFNAKAEIILDAIGRASDLTLRGIRGIIAEAVFSTDVVSALKGWRDITPKGDLPYDCLLEDSLGSVKVQVKLQRLEKKQLKFWRGNREMYVVETQRTRGGHDSEGKKTRPYRYGEFDILAVCLHPATSNWSNFIYTVSDWLLPSRHDAGCIGTLQPVSATENGDWTKDFLTAVKWFRKGAKRQILAPKRVPHSGAS
jgi:hypothetical protein